MKNSNARRLAFNTLFMYIRMAFHMAVSLYMSRVVLRALGVEDFGTYNLVGSIVAIFSSLRILFSSATQRFLNFEMGLGNEKGMSMVFSMSILINIIISLIFIFFAEVIGWWFFEYKINISPSRVTAAQLVYQFSIMSAVLSIMTTPYDAVIIAHEKMNFYAVVSIFEGVLKLLCASLLLVFGGDRLILYGILMFGVAFIIRMVNSVYCKRKFKESHFVVCWDKEYFKKLLFYSGWQFLGNTAFAISQNGLNMVLNIFGGPVVNAARGIAYQVSESTNRLLVSVSVVVNPFSIKSFAEGKIETMNKLFFFSSKTMYLIQLILTIPLFLFIDIILKLWLGVIPDYSIPFVRIILVYSLVRSLHWPIDTLFKSVGLIKWYQISEGLFLLLPIFFSYFLLSSGYDYIYAFYVVILFEILNLCSILIIASHLCGISLLRYLKNVTCHCLITSSIPLLLFHFISLFFDDVLNHIILLTSSWLFILAYMCLYGYNKEEMSKFKEIIKK